MSVHAGLRAFSLMLRGSTTSSRDDEFVVFASAGVPSGGVLPTGQTLATTQVAICHNQDAATIETLIYATFDGGTTWTALDLGVVPDAVENGSGVVLTSEQLQVRTLLLTLTATPVVMTDNAGVVAFGSLKVADLPEGNICILGAVMDLALTLSAAGINADWDGDVGLGTAATDNNATLASTEQDIIPTTATPQAQASATTAKAMSTSTQISTFDGTTTAKDVYLNLLVDDADHDVTTTDTNIICDGTIRITYVNLGDIA